MISLSKSMVHFHKANYLEQTIGDYAGNPLIEALPPILTEEECVRALSYYPETSENYAHLSKEERKHLIFGAIDFFQPLSIHLLLEQKISRILRIGYLGRNPFKKSVTRNFSYYGIQPENIIQEHYLSPMLGFAVYGLSGVGKTTGINRILSLYHQVILHEEYRGNAFPWVQLVWLKIDTPFDGSTRGICLNFFQEVDRLLNTSYLSIYGKDGRATIYELVLGMAVVANIHSLGMLIIDEIQNLNVASNAQKTLNFFVQLDNVIKLPIVKIGTPAIIPVFQSALRQARRASGQGCLQWKKLKRKTSNKVEIESEWRFFLETLWEFQYIENQTRLSDQLSQAFFEETQGIIDLTVKLFFLVQCRAISTGKEEISVDLIHALAKEKFCLLAPLINAIRCKDLNALRQLGNRDVVIDFDSLMDEELRNSFRGVQHLRHKKATTNEVSDEIEPGESENNTHRSPKTKRKKRKQTGKREQGLLPEIFDTCVNQKRDVVEALKDIRLIKNPLDDGKGS
jgi:hypothetical protein